MDVLVCPSCGGRFAVHSSGTLGGWRCTNCNNELETVSRNAFGMSLLRPPTYHLRALDGEFRPVRGRRS